MTLTLTSKQPQTNDVTTFIFSSPTPISWQPGQFIKYQLNHDQADDRGTSRYFTISSAPFEEQVAITTRFAADHGSSFKGTLHHLNIGDTIEASEPMGEFVLQEPSAGYVLISGGIGITPFRSMLAQGAHDHSVPAMRLLYANRDDQFVFKSELEAIAQANPSLATKYFVEPQRLSQEDLDQAKKELGLDKVYYYLSGPKAMVQAYEQMLLDAGYDQALVKTDYFPGYK